MLRFLNLHMATECITMINDLGIIRAKRNDYEQISRNNIKLAFLHTRMRIMMIRITYLNSITVTPMKVRAKL